MQSARQCLMIRTDTTLDQDCVLKATVSACTPCMIVSLLTTCMNFNTPPLAQVAPFRYKISRVKRGSNIGHKTQQARLPADSGLYNSTFPSLVNCILTIPECESDHHGSCTSTAWSRQRVCSLYHPRASLGSRKFFASPLLGVSQFTKFLLLVVFVLLLALDPRALFMDVHHVQHWSVLVVSCQVHLLLCSSTH